MWNCKCVEMRLKGWKIGFYWVAWIVCLGLLSCEKEALETPDDNLCLYIQVPSTQTTKAISDPGLPTQEGEDWDRLAVIFVYDDYSLRVDTMTKTQFLALPSYNGNENIKMMSIYAKPGTMHIYGATYSCDVKGCFGDAIKACKTETELQQLTISNDYAQGAENATSKFLSVATGYYKDSDGNLADYVIKADGTGTSNAVMTLTRLAAKIDIQWDAVDAYDQGYTDVKVTGFNYNGKTLGRLFPDVTLPTGTTITNNDKSWTFYNTSEISQRNGRVYHYTFPDGVSKPSVTFNITATQNSSTTSKGYTMTFPVLQQATWYKVNATIKGITGSGTITLGN